MDCIRVTHPCAGRRQRYCYLFAAPRLACVRPVASVHPEPGSNSSLYYLFFYSFILTRKSLPFPCPGVRILVSFRLDVDFSPLRSPGEGPSLSTCYFLSIVMMSMNFLVTFRCPSLSESGCKSTRFFIMLQIFSKLFLNFFL